MSKKQRKDESDNPETVEQRSETSPVTASEHSEMLLQAMMDADSGEMSTRDANALRKRAMAALRDTIRDRR